MKPFSFVQFRIPAGKITDIYEKPLDIGAILANSPFMEALKGASLHFWETVTTEKLTEEHHKTLYKYYSRWCTRCTPFGRFSGVFTADLSGETSFREAIPHVYTEPDIQEKKKLTRLLNDAKLRRAGFRVNSSLYTQAGKHYLLQYLDEKYHQVSFERFGALDTVLQAAGSEVSYAEIENILVNHDFTKEDAESFVRELLEEQVLCTGFEFNTSETLQNYRHRQQMTFLPGFTRSYTFTVYPDAEIDREIIHTIVEDVKKLGKFFRKEPHPRLTAFRDEFIRRFEDREIPLAEALDPELGIRYGTYNLTPAGELLDQLSISPEPSAPKPALPSLLLDKYIACMASGGDEISFTAEELDTGIPEENITSYIFGSLLKKGPDFMFLLKQAGGSSAVNLTSRFSLGNDLLAEKLREITAYEQSVTDAILAEVIHLPEGKIGNVVLHAPLREYQIHYLGHDTHTSLPLSDLLVSVSGNEVVLRSRKYNKRVIPYLSHAYNYATGLPVYNFLGDLQPAGAQFTFDWGVLSDREYLPRVTFKHLILWRATWNLTQKNIERIKNTLPRHIVIIESDHELYLDLFQPVAQKILQDHLKKNAETRVQEFLYPPDQCFVNDRSSEVVIPVMGENPKPFTKPVPLISGRSYPPGSEWLYLKLYTGPRTADNLLRDKIRPFVQLLKQKGLIQKWFFIRYHDPGFHIRLRFYHDSNPGFYTAVTDLFHTHFKEELSFGSIYELQITCYQPEYNRYPDMQQAETLFMQDSERVLERLESDAEIYRIETSLIRIHTYLSCLTLPEKVSFCQRNRDGFLEELGVALKPKLNGLYRQHLTWIKATMDKVSPETFLPSEPGCLASYIHMHVNRNFISDARKYEMLLYHFLYRYYDSVLARKNLDVSKII